MEKNAELLICVSIVIFLLLALLLVSLELRKTLLENYRLKDELRRLKYLNNHKR